MNEHSIKKCFFKPHNEEVKLELNINVNSPNFDSGRAEIIAHEVDGDKESSKKDSIFFENDIVDRVFLQSIKAADNPNRYAVATYNGKEIHLTALKGMNTYILLKSFIGNMLQEFFNFDQHFLIWRKD